MLIRTLPAVSTLALALSLVACAPKAPPVAAIAPPPVAAPEPPKATASERLAKLFTDSDEASLKRNPIQGVFRGDLRYADQFGDYITDAYLAGEKAASESDLAVLASIDRAALNADEQISYDVFKYQTEMGLRGFAPDLLAVTVVRPVDHFNGFQTFMPDFSSGDGAAPFKTLVDYENNLKRIDGYTVLLDRSIERMRQGLAAGVTNPRLVMQNVVDQMDNLIAQGVEGSTFYGPVKKFPADFTDADKARLTEAYRSMISGKLQPAHKRLRDFLANDYVPKARTEVGLSAMPGGANLYRYMVEQTTTTRMTPEEIHALGLSEVARIQADMTKVKNQVGFKGTLAQFFVHMRTSPKFRPASKEALRDAYFAAEKKVNLRVGELFSTMPKSKLDIRPVPAYREKTDAGGSYQAGTPDGSRPGVFYYNSYDLPSRSTWGVETLFLHEGAPGHHFQISLAQENDKLPPFQRYGGNTAYVEGWALYAESLGPELGMFTDPYQMYGRLDDEMLRAMRLVVDTGLHSKGWGRDQSIKYMLDNSAMGKTDATAEVERYIAIPSQALAYKVGQLTIRRLRTKAETELGAKFDVRGFHAQVLMSGALPMAVLESKIDAWIAARKAG